MDISIHLRDATAGDEAFLYSLHRATMREYVIATWGAWDEADQRRRFAAGFAAPPAVQVIVFEEQDIGSLIVERRDADIYVARLEVMPAFQGRGVGSTILRTLLAQSAAMGGHVELAVLKANGRAKRLYDRLGFRTTAEHAERYFMRST